MNGNKLYFKIDTTAFATYSTAKKKDWALIRTMAHFQKRTKAYLVYGELMRPPEISCPATIVNFVYTEPVYQSIETTKILASCFKASDETLGLVFVNFTDDQTTSKIT